MIARGVRSPLSTRRWTVESHCGAQGSFAPRLVFACLSCRVTAGDSPGRAPLGLRRHFFMWVRYVRPCGSPWLHARAHFFMVVCCSAIVDLRVFELNQRERR